MTNFKNLLLKNHWANFNQTWHKSSLCEGDSSLFKWKALPFGRGDNYKIVKIHWWIWKIIFFQTNGSISTKLGTMHRKVKGIQVSSNEGPRPFPRGHNYEIAKIHWRIWKFFSRTTGPISTKLGIEGNSSLFKYRALPFFLKGYDYKFGKIHWRSWKIIFSRTTGPISTKLGTMRPRMKGIQVCPNERPVIIWLKYCQYSIKHQSINQSSKGPYPFPRGDSTLF